VNTDIYDRFAVERYEKLQEEKKEQKRLQEEREKEKKERFLMKENDVNATYRGIRLGSSSSSSLSIEDIRRLRLKRFKRD
jgi:hypothetical protein